MEQFQQSILTHHVVETNASNMTIAAALTKKASCILF